MDCLFHKRTIVLPGRLVSFFLRTKASEWEGGGGGQKAKYLGPDDRKAWYINCYCYCDMHAPSAAKLFYTSLKPWRSTNWQTSGVTLLSVASLQVKNPVKRVGGPTCSFPGARPWLSPASLASYFVSKRKKQTCLIYNL